MINFFSNAIIPIIILIIIIYGVKKKVNIYDVFIEGAKESIELAINLFPSMLAMILGVNIFLKSGIIDAFFDKLSSIFMFLRIPYQILPMMIMRPISGSSALAILTNIFQVHGPDSFLGVLGSILQGSTDTTFYILTIYFGTIGVKKIKYALTAGVIADIICIIISIIIVNLIL
ncbi:MAG: spore maturation protein [Bacilli bacterium]|nr:spore maturation protein [Bacilli bacterium]